jgi:hypothetical protein
MYEEDDQTNRRDSMISIASHNRLLHPDFVTRQVLSALRLCVCIDWDHVVMRYFEPMGFFSQADMRVTNPTGPLQ